MYFFQHFFAPADTCLLLSVCQIVRDPTQKSLFYSQIVMQYHIDACHTNDLPSHEILYDDLVLLVPTQHRYFHVQQQILAYLYGLEQKSTEMEITIPIFLQQ